jgi:hypothetical protein
MLVLFPGAPLLVAGDRHGRMARVELTGACCLVSGWAVLAIADHPPR